MTRLSPFAANPQRTLSSHSQCQANRLHTTPQSRAGSQAPCLLWTLFCWLVLLLSPQSEAQPALLSVVIVDDQQQQVLLDREEASFSSKLLQRYAEQCQSRQGLTADEIPSQFLRRLWVDNPGLGSIQLLTHAHELDSRHAQVLVVDQDGRVQRLADCGDRHLLPVLALLLETDLSTSPSLPAAEITESNPVPDPLFPLGNRILAGNTLLSSYEPNRLMARADDNDDNWYMDFTVSLKHPLFWRLTDKLSRQLLDENQSYLQLYMAFTGRFSQYLGTRYSAPVIPRRFSPDFFLRYWQSEADFMDFGLAHESNGQQINNEELFDYALETLQRFDGDPRYARDEISRGWDFLHYRWHRQWIRGSGQGQLGALSSHLELRHYLDRGPMQREIEQYNAWEGFGEANRPIRNYDGLRFSITHHFPQIGGYCLADDLLCLDRITLTQSTGSGSPFRHNTTALELTTTLGGLPIVLWGRSGYNSDLVDYFQYVNSVGLGLQILNW